METRDPSKKETNWQHGKLHRTYKDENMKKPFMIIGGSLLILLSPVFAVLSTYYFDMVEGHKARELIAVEFGVFGSLLFVAAGIMLISMSFVKEVE